MRNLFYLKRILGVSVFSLVFSLSAKAQVSVPHLEAFNYTSGTFLVSTNQTAAGWTNLNTGDAINISAGNLSYSNLTASIGNKISFDGAGMDAYKVFTTQTSGTVYFSFLLNVTSLGSLNTTGGYFTSLVNSSGSFGTSIWLRASGVGYNIGINPLTTAANTVWSSTVLPVNTTVLIVASCSIVAGANNDVVKMWINPVLGTPEPGSSLSATNAGTDMGTIARVLLRQDGNTTTPFIEMDELRIANSWSDVAPAVLVVPTVTSLTASSLSGVGATLNGNISSDGGSAITERGFFTKTSSGVTSGDTKRVEGGTSSGAFSLAVTGLSVNSQYFFKAYASNSIGNTLSSEQSFWTLANTPSAPNLSSATTSTLTVAVGSGDGNPSGTEYAIQETGGSLYLQANGSLGVSAVWQTSAAWGTKTVTGLSSGTSYTFQVKARNGANTDTSFGSTTSLSTSAASGILGLSGTLSAFSSTYGSASLAQSFTVTGSGLDGTPVTVTPPLGFEVSTTETFDVGTVGTSGSALNLGSSASISATIYVRLASVTGAGSAYGGNISVDGGGASMQTISVPTSSVAKAEQATVSGLLGASSILSTQTTTVTASGGSGAGAYDFQTVPGTGTISFSGTGSSRTVSFLTAGSVEIQVRRLGDTNYNDSAWVSAGILTLSKADQTITFDPLPSKSITDGPFSLGATNSASLAISFASSDVSVATVSGSIVTIVGSGTTTITASQAGTDSYNPALSISRTLAVSSASPLIAAWDFQTTTSGGTAILSSPNSPTLFAANIGAGSLYLDGSNGSSLWLAASELTGFGGSALNASSVGGMSSSTVSPSALAPLGGTSNSANGKKMVFKFSMAGKKDLSVSYVAQRTSTGFTTHAWETSTDGTTWVALQTISSIPSSFGLVTMNNISALNDDSEVFLRVTFSGATAASGNNRLDNFQLRAANVPTITQWPTATAITYGQTLADSTLSNDGVASVPGSFAFASPSTAPNAGSYSAIVVFTPTDNVNYGSVSTNVSVTVNQVNSVITAWPNASQINYGQALGAAILSGATNSPVGTFAFAAPGTVPNKTGISSYPVVFTPTDAVNYNTATNDVSIMVNSVAQPVYGVTDSQNFEGFTTSDLLESANSWSTDDDYVDPGDTYANGFRPDADGGIAASIGGWITGTPVYRMKYQFDSGTSDRLVFTWKQNIESSADPALPAPDRFGWQFKSGTNVLFSLKMAQFVDSNGNGTWDPATNSIPAEPLAVAANDQPGGYTDTNGVSLYMTNKVVVVGYDSNGNQLTTAELPNFAVLDRDAWYEFRVIVDLHSHLWFAQLKSGANYVNLTGVSGAPLPNSITSVDEMVALWELNDTTVTGGIEPEPYDDTYEMGGSNQMLFDELAITGSKIVELSLATSDKTYNGNPQGATVGESVSGGSVVTYNGSSTVPTDYGYVAVSLSTVSPYFGVVATNAATLYETPATLTGSYWINRKPVTITGLSANNKAYNGNFVAVLSGTPALNGVVAGDVANLAGTPNVQFAQKDVGTNIAVSINGGWTLDGADAANYQLQLPTFTADIGKATLTLTAQNKTRQYGQTNPPLTFTYSGFVGRMSGGVEDASDLDAVPTISTLADQNSNVGNYDITFLGGSDDNYDFNFVPASLSVTAAPLPAVTFTALSGLTYDGNPQDFMAEASGVPGMTFNYLFTGTTFGGTAYSNATAPVNAGTYSLVVTSTDTNYSGSATNSFTIAKANQTINIAALTETKTYGDFPYNLMASTDSLLTLSYTSSDTGVATVDSNGDVVIAGAGLASVTVSQAGNANYEPALDVIYSLTVNKANQIISGISPSEIKTFGDPSYSLGGSSDSSLPLSYASSDDNVATVDATGEVTIVGAGVVTITVSQIGDGNYEPATDVTHGLTVNKAAQAISGVAATAEPKTYGDPSYNLGASTDSLLGLTYVSDNPAVATVDATGEVTIVGAGVATITVSQGGDGNYEPAMDMTHVLTVNKADQTISGVAATETKTYGDLPYNLFASTDSSLPLDYYSDNPNVATVDANGEVTIVGAGVATITVSQMGGDNHFPADVTHVLTVNKAAQTISGVAATETKTYGDSSYNLGASTSSSLLLTYTSDTPTVATVDAAGEVTIVGAGVVTITVSQSGGDNYDQATDVTQTLTVAKANPVIVSAPTASGINLGQALSASTLSGGSANGVDGNSLAGGFAFTDATEVPGATGTYSASVTFTPTDGDNYNPVTTNVDVTVNTATTPAEDYLASFGLTGANAALTADPDGDGLNNAQEFAFGAVPNVAGSLPITTSNIGGSLKMVFLGRTNGITYNVLSYTNLRVAAVSTNAPTASATQPTNLPAGYKQYEATVDSSTGTRKFLKVDAVIP